MTGPRCCRTPGEHHGYGRDGRRLRCLDQLPTDAVRTELVGDAVAGHTPGDTRALGRWFAALDRLARVEHAGDLEEAFAALDREVVALSGRSMAAPFLAQLDRPRASAT